MKVARPIRFFFLWICLIAVLVPAFAYGQSRPSRGITVPDVRPIDPEEGRERIQEFRSIRGGLDTILSGQLIHSPRRGDRQVYPIYLFTAWEQQNMLMRLRIDKEKDTESDALLLLLHGGAIPSGWLSSSNQNGDNVMVIPLEEFLRPLLPGLELSSFDLLAPYIDWPEFSYIGSERVAGSPAHWFEFIPPAEWVDPLVDSGISSVRVALDTRFDTPVRVEYLDDQGDVLRTLNVRSFKRVDGVWLVRGIEALNRQTRERTELHIRLASVNLQLPFGIWNPDSFIEQWKERYPPSELSRL